MSPKATREELMIIAVAREIKDYERILLGVGLPTTAGGLAKATHAPNSVLMTEAGIIDFKPLVPPNHIADVMCLRGFSYALDLFNTFTTINYRGFVDKAILGVGQVDRYGNINTSFIGGTAKTGMRLTGAGGAPDFISYAKETILTLKGGEFVEKLDYFTSPGYMGGGEERDRCGLFRRRVRAQHDDLHGGHFPLRPEDQGGVPGIPPPGGGPQKNQIQSTLGPAGRRPAQTFPYPDRGGDQLHPYLRPPALHSPRDHDGTGGKKILRVRGREKEGEIGEGAVPRGRHWARLVGNA